MEDTYIHYNSNYKLRILGLVCRCQTRFVFLPLPSLRPTLPQTHPVPVPAFRSMFPQGPLRERPVPVPVPLSC